MRELTGQVALVTGAGGGIGRASALAFARLGAAVLVSDIRAEAAEETADQIRALGGDASFRRADITSDVDVSALIGHAVSHYGRLDFAHNNAGIEDVMALAADTAEADFDRSIGINLKGAFLCMKHELQHMRGRTGSVIVNTASVGALTALPQGIAYGAAKAGVVAMTRTVAIEYAPHVRCVAICPGLTRTDMTQRIGEKAPEMIGAALPPLGRMAEPGEMGGIAAWLCTPTAAYITGQTIVADGGWTAI